MRPLLTPPARLARTFQTIALVRFDPRIAPLPCVVLAPDERRLNGRSRPTRNFQQVQRIAYKFELHRRIVRFPTRIAKRKVREQKTGNTAFLNDVASGSDDDSRYAIRFQLSRNQTHGLVTHRSEGNEQGDVGLVFATTRDDLRGILLDGSTLAVICRHTMKALGQRTNPTRCDQ